MRKAFMMSLLTSVSIGLSGCSREQSDLHDMFKAFSPDATDYFQQLDPACTGCEGGRDYVHEGTSSDASLDVSALQDVATVAVDRGLALAACDAFEGRCTEFSKVSLSVGRVSIVPLEAFHRDWYPDASFE